MESRHEPDSGITVSSRSGRRRERPAVSRPGGARTVRPSAGARRRPRLTFCFPHLERGGGELATLEIARWLRPEFELEAVAPGFGRRPRSPALVAELERRFDRVVLTRHRWELRGRLAATDAVLFYGVTPAVPKALAALPVRPAAVRLVHTERAVDGPGYHQRWGRHLDRTVCVSPASARRIPGALFLANGCDPARLEGEARRWLGAGAGRPTLCFVGRLAPPKNVPWLVDHLEAAGANLLVQAIDTPSLGVADLERRARRAGVGDRVRFLPPGDRVGTALRSADALVLPSATEGLPLAVLEAGLLGRPVVATPVGALPELFPDEIVYLEPGADGLPDPASLTRAVARLREPEAAELGERLRSRVAELCDPARLARRWRALFDSVLAERAASAASYSSSASSPK